MIHWPYDVEILHNSCWRQMMTSCKKWRHPTIWSWKYTPKRKKAKNADQAFLGGVFCLNSQKWRFWLIFSMIFQFPSKKLGILTFFWSAFFWPAKFEVIIIINSDFHALNWICVWTPTRIDLKFSGDLQDIEIYSQ